MRAWSPLTKEALKIPRRRKKIHTSSMTSTAVYLFDESPPTNPADNTSGEFPTRPGEDSDIFQEGQLNENSVVSTKDLVVGGHAENGDLAASHEDARPEDTYIEKVVGLLGSNGFCPTELRKQESKEREILRGDFVPIAYSSKASAGSDAAADLDTDPDSDDAGSIDNDSCVHDHDGSDQLRPGLCGPLSAGRKTRTMKRAFTYDGLEDHDGRDGCGTLQATTKEISYSTQQQWIHKIYRHLGIHITKVTHAGRGSGPKEAEKLGIDHDQIQRQGWAGDAMHKGYWTSLPRAFMRGMAGFQSEHAGTYFIARAEVEPPQELLDMAFPKLNYWLR
ncbi:uncharacterized protein CPUR_01391 [Claviceps purpurea 20.1]|uniref:Ndc10 domain-containing protein n=1 Tax=Claviceps purpurea (strain 20.1) TaxID=1111077 RepID=M1VUK2_CLAP2|nr:uncharacterized protein CPUR_01391 [Claviceps purpurea 20.1]